MFNDINKDYKFLADLRSGVLDQSQDLWEARLFKWINKLVTNDEIDPNKISKFRATSALLSEVPRNPYLDKTFKKHIYEYLRFPGYKKTCFHNFEKLCHDDSLIWESFSQVGEPIYYESDGKKFNERFLRHLRTVSIIEKNISLKSGSIVVDIGGGYGQFIAMMHYKFDSAKKILIDFPEQLLVASYFLKKSFPDAKINTIRSCYEKNISITSMLKNNDFVLIPVDQLHLLNDIEVDLVCNFSSFGEMSVDNFTGYMSGSLISNASTRL